MSTRTDYGQLADKLDYPTLERRLAQLADREPPKSRKTAADVLEPLREKLLALHRKGWTSSQLVEELKAAGVPVSPARFRECLNRWNRDGNGSSGRRRTRPSQNQSASAKPTLPPSLNVQSKSGFSKGPRITRAEDL